MATEIRDQLLRQFKTASALLHYHLDTLSTEECLWRPAAKGLHVRQSEDGAWRADWPDSESYDMGPPSAAWITWHVGFWWSMVLDHSFGEGMLTRQDILWPGSAEATASWIGELETRWRASLEPLDDTALASFERTRWPYSNRPFGDVVGWVNIELTKNAAEIGMARFFYAVRNG